jgi:hypothetical protein
MVFKNNNPLDLFHLLPEQRISICRSFEAGAVTRHLVTHIRAHHRGLHFAFKTKQSAIEWVQDRLITSLPCALLDPELLLDTVDDVVVRPTHRLPKVGDGVSAPKHLVHLHISLFSSHCQPAL